MNDLFGGEVGRIGLERVVELAHRHLGLDVTYVVELTDAGEVYRAAAGHAASFNIVLQGDPVETTTYCRRLVDGEIPNVIADAAADERLDDLAKKHGAQIGAVIGVPLRLSDGRLFGALCGLSRTPRPQLDQRDVQFMSMLSESSSNDLDELHSQDMLRSDILRLVETEDLKVAYQPIVALHNDECLGIEALARFPEPFTRPDSTLADAERFGLGLELERMVIRQAWKILPVLGPGQFLALNVSPDALVELARRANLRSDLPLSQLVVEVTEHSVVDSYEALHHELAPLREQGLRIAVDDAGAGYASLRHVLELRPDFIKVDRWLIHGIARDHARRVAVGAFLSLALDLGADVVAEGVERPEDLRVAHELGLHAAQGYLLGRPTTDLEVVPRWLSSASRAKTPKRRPPKRNTARSRRRQPAPARPS